jgi:hypothetical protein
MAKVTVYQWAKYDIRDDASQRSRRWATREAIEWAGGYPIEDTAIEIDDSVVSAVMRMKNGGRLDFWTLENGIAGRGRRYHRIVDHAGRKRKQYL